VGAYLRNVASFEFRVLIMKIRQEQLGELLAHPWLHSDYHTLHEHVGLFCLMGAGLIERPKGSD
jgi:hypothetical protein